MKIVGAIFEKMKILIFLCELLLNLRADRKRRKRAGDICKRTLDIESERDWSVDLGATLGDGQKIKNYFFLLSGIFPGIADSVILLGFQCTINSENLIKIFGAIFEKIKIFNF